MRTKIVYICEICGNENETKSYIKTCENKGLFDETLYPQGLMFPYHHNGYVGICAIPDNVKHWIDNPHLGYSSNWISKIDDIDILDELCYNPDMFSNDIISWIENNKISEVNTPEFLRMVSFLKSKNIVPKYYNEEGILISL
jgi:hypothetical protein